VPAPSLESASWLYPRRMQIGAVFPTCEIGPDPVAVRDWAQTAEGLGYRHVVIYDHVLGAVHEDREPPLLGPYTERDPFHEPFVLLAYLAGVTRHLELATGVLILPQRQTALVAKQAAELDILSGGRLRLGVGTGWNFVEYASLGVPFENRGRRLDEQVKLLRELWTQPVLAFDGEFHTIERAGILPHPAKCPPIWFGGSSDAALRRAALVGDGFLHAVAPSRIAPLQARLRELLQAAERDPDAFPSEAIIDISCPRDGWNEEIETWRAAGGTHVSLRAMDTAAQFVGVPRAGLEAPADHIRALELFAREVGLQAG
jgi:probable F420-dependent oxidoreductase